MKRRLPVIKILSYLIIVFLSSCSFFSGGGNLNNLKCHGFALIPEYKHLSCAKISKTDTHYVLTLIKPNESPAKENLQITVPLTVAINTGYTISDKSDPSVEYKNTSSLIYTLDNVPRQLKGGLVFYKLPTMLKGIMTFEVKAMNENKSINLGGVVYADFHAKEEVSALKSLPASLVKKYNDIAAKIPPKKADPLNVDKKPADENTPIEKSKPESNLAKSSQNEVTKSTSKKVQISDYDPANCQGKSILVEAPYLGCVSLGKNDKNYMITIDHSSMKELRESIEIQVPISVETSTAYAIDDKDQSSSEANTGSIQFIRGTESTKLKAAIGFYVLPHPSGSEEIAFELRAFDSTNSIQLNGLVYGNFSEKGIDKISKIPSSLVEKYHKFVNLDRAQPNLNKDKFVQSTDQPAPPLFKICTKSLQVENLMLDLEISIEEWEGYKDRSYLGPCKVALRPER